MIQETLTMCDRSYVRTKTMLAEDSVDRPSPAENGFFHVCSNGILFSDPSGEPFAFLVANRHNERFFVTASRHKPSAPISYMFSICGYHAEQLNLPEGCLAKHDVARETWNTLHQKLIKP